MRAEEFKDANRQAYGDLKTLVVKSTKEEVLAACKAALTSLPQASIVAEVVDSDGAVTLEVLDVTRLMRFKDDMAIR